MSNTWSDTVQRRELEVDMRGLTARFLNTFVVGAKDEWESTWSEVTLILT